MSSTISGSPSRITAALGWLAGIGAILLGIGCIVIPLFAGRAAIPIVAVAAMLFALGEAVYGQSRWLGGRRRSALVDAALSLFIGIALFMQPSLAYSAVILLVAGSVALAGLTSIGVAVWGGGKTGRRWAIISGVAHLTFAVLLAIQWPISGLTLVGMVVGAHILAMGLSMLSGERPAGEREQDLARHPDPAMGLEPDAHIAAMRQSVLAAEATNRPRDAWWQVTLIVVFLAIHIGRMQAQPNLVSLISPLFATVGDALSAILLALLLIMPAQRLWHRLTRRFERRAWRWALPRMDASGPRVWAAKRWLARRLRFAERDAIASASVGAGLNRALNLGLPVIAVIIAISPILGFNWYFNSENWPTMFWERWAEHRTDTWREGMARAVAADCQRRGIPASEVFALRPDGIDGAGDFSFIVIGDPGEGDASQLVLKDVLLAAGGRPDSRFMVISSDVIYPAGAMLDYEPKFYLPFKGYGRPIYAIPGNHDWYDALEGFNANFLEPHAAGIAIRQRIETDLGLTSTTDRRVDEMVTESARLRQHYGISAAHQRAPYFEIHADRFSLIAADTGIARTLDPDQRQWLREALGRAGARFKMVILGHPLYAGGAYQGKDDPEFAAIHKLLRDYDVEVVMAGDTHDLEYYRESRGPGRWMHHLVNGGGGAYLSIGTALSWPATPPVPDCAIYPNREDVVAKLNAETPVWKRPLWFWVKSAGAWPATPEALAAAFNYDRAPFFQSFVEVRVERSANRVRFLPYTAYGPLKWGQMHATGQARPPGASDTDAVEFVTPMR